jgi:hypothetical protein
VNRLQALVDDLMRYEDGSLTEEEVVSLFQRLIDARLTDSLQGHYGRTAAALVDAGLCTPPAAPKED